MSKPPIQAHQAYSYAQACDLLSVSPRTLYRLISTGVLKRTTLRSGGKRGIQRITGESLQRAAAGQSLPDQTKAKQPSRYEPAPSHRPRTRTTAAFV